jgi:site-specific recombinase XerD
MKASDARRGGLLGPVLQRYFCEYLISQRRLSACTVAAYRDSFKLLLAFLERQFDLKPDDLRVDSIDVEHVLAFLDDLERGRHNCARSRNARLAAIRSFFRFATAADPLLLPIAQRVLAIPSKRYERALVGFLQPNQIQALLDAPDMSTRTGLRDRLLVTLMYNTGARVSELAALKVGDLSLATGGSVRLRGKGRKERSVPLWRESVRLLRDWLKRMPSTSDAPLLPNSRGGHMTRSGIDQRLRVVLELAAKKDPTLRELHLSPHTIRHTTAMHLLQSGVDLSVIAMWLGHEDIGTTHQYLDADLETKKRALGRLPSPAAPRPRHKRRPKLIEFLRRL